MSVIVINDDSSETLRRVKITADEIIQSRLDNGEIKIEAKLIADKIQTDHNSLNSYLLLKHGLSIESIFISRILEKVKELLVYSSLSISQISRKLGYNNSLYLSEQLKLGTGFTSSYYKQIRKRKLEIIKSARIEK